MASLCMTFIPMVMMAYDCEVGGIFYNLDTNTKTAEVTYEEISYTSDSHDSDYYIHSPYSGDVVIPATFVYDDDGETYTVTSIGKEAFFESEVKSVSIPNTVTSIGDWAFRFAELTSVIVEWEEPLAVPDNIFEEVSLDQATLYVPEGTRAVYMKADVWKDFGRIIDDPVPDIYAQVDGMNYYLYTTTQTATVADNSMTDFDSPSVVIPATIDYENVTYTVTSIGSSAFEECSSLTSVTIPNSVTNIGSSAFSGCDNLTRVIVDIPTPIELQVNTFSNYGATLFVPKGSKEAYMQADEWMNFSRILEFTDDAFTDTDYITFADPVVKEICVGLWDINEDGELSKAEAALVDDLEEAFLNNDDITSFDELQYFTGLERIAECSFLDCHNLAGITLPESLTAIEGKAFQGCTSLTGIHIPAAVTEIGYSIVGDCTQLQTITVAEENACFYSPDNCNAIIERETDKLVSGCKNTVVPDFVTVIGAEAFKGCEGLTAIDLPATLTCIEGRAFAYSGLTAVTIPNTVTQVDAEAFIGCTSLASVVLPDALTTISLSTFEDCTSLADIEIPATVTTIEGAAFEDCTSLTSITIPRSVTSIDNYVFYGCTNLVSVVVDIPTPLAIDSKTFSNYDATLYVPKGSEEAYGRANYWKQFMLIEKIYIPVPYALLAKDKKTLTFYCDDAGDECEGTVYAVDDEGTPSWLGQCASVTTVIFDVSFIEEHPTSLRQWFDGMTKLMSVEGMENLCTDEATTMTAMFRDCSSLRRIDLEHLDISKAADISEMFSGCTALASLDLSSCVLAEGTNTDGMLLGCGGLKTLKLPESMAGIADNACRGVGTDTKPCVLFVPDGFAFDTDATDIFLWKSGYFRVASEPVVYANDVEFSSGQTKGVTICLNNGTEKYSGYQFDLTLPEGFMFVSNASGELIYTLSDRYASSPTVSASQIDESTCRMMVYLESGEYIEGTGGPLITLSVNADGDLPSETMEAMLTNVFVTLPGNASFKCEDSAFNLIVNPEVEHIPGDANHDGFVNISDVSVVIAYILNKQPSPFYINEADINADGWINVSDVSGIIAVILHTNQTETPANICVSATDQMLISPAAKGYDLILDNATPYTACEMTLHLPEGCSLSHAVMADGRDDHKVMVHSLGDGTYRLVVYSSENMSLETGTAAMLRLFIDGGTSDDVRLSNILFVDGQYTCVAFPDVTGTTGIIGITTTVPGTEDSPAYNLQGISVGKTTRGVQIRNGQKVVVK